MDFYKLASLFHKQSKGMVDVRVQEAFRSLAVDILTELKKEEQIEKEIDDMIIRQDPTGHYGQS